MRAKIALAKRSMVLSVTRVRGQDIMTQINRCMKDINRIIRAGEKVVGLLEYGLHAQHCHVL